MKKISLHSIQTALRGFSQSKESHDQLSSKMHENQLTIGLFVDSLEI